MVRRLILALSFALLPAALPAQSLKVSESVETLETRARADSNDPAVHYNLAMGYWSKKRYADAERELRLSTGIEPGFAEGWLALSVVRNWDEDFWKGVRKTGGDTAVTRTQEEYDRYYRRAFLIDPMVDIKILGSTYQIRGYGRLLNGLRSLVEGGYDKAYTDFDKDLHYLQGRQPLDSVPEGMLFLHGMAAVRTSPPHNEEALGDYQNLLDRMVRSATADSAGDVPLDANEYRYLIAALYQRMGRLDDAVKMYREVLENDLGNFMAHVQLARINEAAGNWDAAIAERQRAVEANPENSDLQLGLGILLGRRGRFAEARDVFSQAAQQNPRDTRLLYWLGVACTQLQKPAEAREALSRFVSLAPSRYGQMVSQAKQQLASLP